MALIRVTSYAKNVARSFGYVLTDMSKEYAPSITSMAKDTKDTTKELYTQIKSWTDDLNTGNKSVGGKIKEQSGFVFKNLVDDIKTGKWYNKERQMNFTKDMMNASMGGEFDTSAFDDWNSDDWGDDEDFSSSSESNTKAIVNESERSTAKVISGMDKIAATSSAAINQGTAMSANYVAQVNNANAAAMRKLTESGFNSVTKALMLINGRVDTFTKLGQPLANHMQNSATFFSKTTQQLNHIAEGIDKLVENTTPADKKKGYHRETGMSDLFYDGRFDISSYINMIKKNVSDDKEFIDMMKESLKGMSLKNFSAGAVMSKILVGALFPKMLRDSIKTFDETFKYAIHDLFVRGKSKLEDNGSFPAILASTYLFPQKQVKTTMDTKYERGKIDWDGEAKRSLTVVIPTYLSKIYSAVSGEDETRYNFQTGKFEKVRNVRIREEQLKQFNVKRAGGDFRIYALASLNSKGLPKGKRNKIAKEIDEYIWKCLSNDVPVDFRDYVKNSRTFELAHAEEISEIFIEAEQHMKHAGLTSSLNKSNYNIMYNRDRITDDINNRIQAGTDIGLALQDGSYDPNRKDNASRGAYSIGDLFRPDKHGNTLMNYMYGIYKAVAGGTGRRGLFGHGNGEFKETIDEDDYKRYKEMQKSDKYTYDVEAEMEKEFKNNVTLSAAAKAFKGNINEKLNQKGLGFMANSGPVIALTNLVNTITLNFTELIWGKNGVNKGLFGNFKDKLDEMFDGITEKISDKLFGQKDSEGNYTGGILSKARNQFNKAFGDMGSYVSDSFGNAVYGDDYSTIKREKKILGAIGKTAPQTAANGRRVTKTGMVAVSEGELIVPAEMNPFYSKPVNKAAQYANEANAVKNFYGAYADGNVLENIATFLGLGQPDYEGESAQAIFGNAHLKKLRRARKNARANKDTWAGKIHSGANSIADGISGVIAKLFGDPDKDEGKLKDIISEETKTLFGEAKDNLGNMAAGAVVGGGISLVTGALVGPLFGAAIGGAAGLIIKSKAVQDVLFGEYEVNDEGDKERVGGILSKNLSNFMEKQLPNTAIGAAVGGTAGLFMGSPFLGSIVGAGIGFISSSEGAKEFLFGKKDPTTKEREGGVIPDDIIKGLPKAAAGAVVGAMTGPFGIVGNIMVGAGLGYLTSTKDFHEKLFGKEGEEGVLDGIKNTIIHPIVDLSVNITNRVSNWLVRTGKTLTKVLIDSGKKFFKGTMDFVKAALQSPLGKIVAEVAKNVFGSPIFIGLRAIKNLSGGAKTANARTGNLVFDAKAKRNLQAREVLDMVNNSNDRNSRRLRDNRYQMGVYEALSQLESRDDIKNFKNVASMLSDAKYKKTDLSQEQLKKIKSIKGLDNLIREDGEGNLVLNQTGLKSINTESLAALANNEKRRLKNPTEIFHVNVEKKLSLIHGLLGHIADALCGTGTYFFDKTIDIDNAKGSTTKIDLKSEITKANENIVNKWNNGELEGDLDSNLYDMKDSSSVSKFLKDNPGALNPNNTASSFDIIRAQLKGIYEKITTGQVSEATAKAAAKDVSPNSNDIVFDVMSGQNVEVTPGPDGGMDKSSATNKKAFNFRETFINGIKKLPVIGTAIAGISSLMGTMKDKLFGDEKKPGLLTKIKDFLGGKLEGPLSAVKDLLGGKLEGPLSVLGNLFTGGAAGGLFKAIASKATLRTLLGGLITIPAITVALSGGFDELANKLMKKLFGDDKDKTENDGSGGQEETVDENGNIIKVQKSRGKMTDETKEITDPVTGEKRIIGNDNTLSHGLRKNLMYGLLGQGSIGTAAINSTLESAGDMGAGIGKALGIGARTASQSLDDAAMNALREANGVAGKTGAIRAVGNRIANSKVGQAVGNSIVGKAGGKVADKVKNSVATGILGKLRSALVAVGEALAKSPVGAGIGKNFGIAVDALTKGAERNAAKAAGDVAAGAGKAASGLKSFFAFNPMIAIPLGVAAASDAFSGEVYSILGITKTKAENEPTFGEKCLAAIVAAINAMIPGIGNILPNKLIVQILLKIAPKLGIDVSDLQKKRADAAAELRDYNATHEGEELTIEQYNEMNGTMGWKKRVLHSKPVRAVTEKVKGAFKGVKEAGKQFGKNIKDTFTPIAELYKPAFAKVKEGDIKGLWQIIPEYDKEDPAGELSHLLFGYSKIILSIPTLFVCVGKKIKSAFGKLMEGAGPQFANLAGAVGDMFAEIPKMKGLKDLIKVNETGRASLNDDPENPANGISQFAFTIAQVFANISGIVFCLGRDLGKLLAPVAKGVGNSVGSLLKTMGAIGMKALTGHPLEMWQVEYQSQDREGENPLDGVLKVASIGFKALATPMSLISLVGRKLIESLENMDEVKSGWTDLTNHIGTNWDHAKAGEVGQLFSDDMPDNENNPLNGLFKFIDGAHKALVTIPAGISWVGHKIGEGISTIIDNTKTGWENLKTSVSTQSDAAASGDIAKVLSSRYTITKDNMFNPLHGVFGAISNVSTMLQWPRAAFHFVGNLINNTFKKMLSEEDGTTFDKALKDLEQYKKDGKPGEIWKYKLNLKNTNGAMSLIMKGVFTINKLFSFIGASVNGIGGFVKDVLGIGEDHQNSQEATSNYESQEGHGTVKEDYNKKIDNGTVSSQKPMGSGLAAGASGFVSQLDPRYADRGLGGSTVGKSGCGPAVASMVSNGALNMDQAINKAKGYQVQGGTDISYFGDVLGSRGISTRAIDRTQIIPTLGGAGTQVILAGQDPYNRSKANSPFGPNPHYVVASGMDRSGNILIKDPEGSGIRPYSPSILNNVQYSLAAGGAYGGAGQNHKEIWGFLKKKGLSDYAIAGLMGCWQEESSNSSDVLEGNYKLKKDPNQIMGNTGLMNDYTKQVFSLHKVGAKGQSAYKGTDGNLYPGYGLAQWTGPRQQKLIEFAKSHNMDHRKLATQLEYFWSEYTQRPKLQEALSKANSLDAATIAALDFYEMRDGWHNTEKGKTQLAKRLAHAQKIYKDLTGTNGVISSDTGTAVNTMDTAASIDNAGATSAVSGESKPEKLTLSGILGKVTDAFTKFFNPEDEEEDSGIPVGSDEPIDYSGTSRSNNVELQPNVKSAITGNSPSDYMKSILGKLSYSMKGPRNPEKGSADCSSTVQWAVKKATGIDIGGNTGMQYNNANLTPIAYNGGKPLTEIPATAQKDDVMFFARHGSSDKGAKLDHVGHVGLYLGNNQFIDHGSDGGPRIKNGPGQELIKISRITGKAAAGSGLYPYSYSAQQLGSFRPSTYAAAGSGLTGIRTYYGGGAAGVAVGTPTFTPTLAPNDTYVSPSSIPGNNLDAGLLKLLFESITVILKTVSDNTDPIKQILELLQTYLPNMKLTAEDASNIANSAAVNSAAIVSKSTSKSSDVSAQFQSFVNQLADVAKG